MRVIGKECARRVNVARNTVAALFQFSPHRPFTERPIALFYSERAEGPWTPIATGLRNSGHYAWQLDQDVPERVFLRLEIRDEAGNVTACDADEPVTVAPLRPRGRILDVAPVEETRVQPRVYRF